MTITRWTGAVVLCSTVTFVAGAADGGKPDPTAKAKLQELGEFVGQWKGNGEAKDGKGGIWKESINWSWKFKDGDAWLNLDFADSKLYKSGTLKYSPEKKLYVLTMTDKDGTESAYEGEYKRKKLTLTRTDPTTKDKRTIELSTNNEGARLVYEVSEQAKGKGLPKRLYFVSHSNEAKKIAGGKKNECLVTGGLGTIAVAYNGKTYYVCCTGCKEAFEADPKSFVAALEKK